MDKVHQNKRNFILKWFSILVILLITAVGTYGQGSHVYTGAQSMNFGTTDLSASNSWTSFRGAIPGYWSALGNASYTGGTDINNINGYMMHYANAANQPHSFPVGSGTDLRILSLSGTRSATSTIGTAWIVGDPSGSMDPTAPNAGAHDITSVAKPITAVSPIGQWDWQDINNNAVGLTVTVSIPDMTAFSSVDSLRLVGWNGTLWVDLSDTATASGNTENSTLSGVMQAGITALGIGKGVSFETEPDAHVSFINLSINGDVNTNDFVASGTTYGPPSALSGNPTGATISMNTDGTYTFSSPNPGEYNYMVPVCAPSAAPPCPTELLTITVIDGADPTTQPTIHPDVASTLQSMAVTINVLSNDQCNNSLTCVLSNPTLITTPNNGSAVIDPSGTITYTPAANFVGKDSLLYSTCDNQAVPLCDTEYVIITVLPTGSPNTTNANDDFETTPATTTVIGNVLDNDSDPENDAQSVTPQTVVTAQGTFILSANGSYSFTPAPQVNGTVRFIYDVKDNNAALLATDTGTLVIIIRDDEWASTIDFNTTLTGQVVNGNVRTNDIVPALAVYGTPTPLPGNPTGGVISMNASGAYSFSSPNPGVYNYTVSICPSETSPYCITELLSITVIDPTDTTQPPIGHPDAAATLENTPVTLNVLSNDDCISGLNCVLSNPILLSAPSYGTAVVDPNGNISYTPAINFVGIDSVLYSVCDNQSPIPKCDTSYAIFTVLPNGSPNSTFANDDYTLIDDNMGSGNGNALDNDTDPENNTKYAATQNLNLPEGSFVLNTNGTYTFIPALGFAGPVDIVYGIYDDGTPVAFDVATIHILVNTTLTPLPLDLVQFRAYEQNCAAHLKWETMREENVKLFEIQRKEANRKYETIGELPAQGTMPIPQQYAYTDHTAIRIQGGYMYRLKMVDYDGNSNYSPERSLSLSCAQHGSIIKLYPNPVNNALTIRGHELSQQEREVFTIRIYNELGQVMHRAKVLATAGNLDYSINVAAWTVGTYIIHVQNARRTYEYSETFIKE